MDAAKQRIFLIVPPVSDEDATPLACGACGGDYRNADIDEEEYQGATYAVIECRWCTIGRQSPSQRHRWDQHKRRVKDSGIRRRLDR